MKKRHASSGKAALSVGKAIRLPRHDLSKRLQAVLDLVGSLQTPQGLKTLDVIMDKAIGGGTFVVYADTGPYAIGINPLGNHPELSFLHETAHYLEWQAIPKMTPGYRDFVNDPRFDAWLDAVRTSPNYQRIIALRDQQAAGSQAFADLNYLLRPSELWARAYSQYIARKGEGKAVATILFQQIAAENRVTQGKITYHPYWPWSEFSPLQEAMDEIFQGLEWTA